MARAGLASRRQAEEMIKQGRVKVNGAIVREMGVQVEPGRDAVSVDGALVIVKDEPVYVLLHKPVGVVTTMNDPEKRKKVTDLLKGVKTRVYPVGRLDYHTAGLLLLTNDGELAYRLTHPKYKVDKVYQAAIQGIMPEDALDKLTKGVLLEDGVSAPAKIRRIHKGPASVYEITIHEGRNRQVRRMFEAVGFPVTALKRVSFGPLKLGDLPAGAWRYLEDREIQVLKKACRYTEF